jgi:hypothetical protein
MVVENKMTIGHQSKVREEYFLKQGEKHYGLRLPNQNYRYEKPI